MTHSFVFIILRLFCMCQVLLYRIKIAVELGAVTHMLAAVHEIDDDTMIKLRAMCIDEVKRINGVINFEKAVRYQRLD